MLSVPTMGTAVGIWDTRSWKSMTATLPPTAGEADDGPGSTPLRCGVRYGDAHVPPPQPVRTGGDARDPVTVTPARSRAGAGCHTGAGCRGGARSRAGAGCH